MLTAQHRQQMHELRQWARKQGLTPSGETNAARAAVQPLAQDRTLPQPQTNLSEQVASPAPEISHD